MPLKLVPPRKGKSPCFTVRGTYLGVYVDRSTRARKRATAAKVLKKWELEIERGEFSDKPEKTFASAAAAYMKAGGERTYIKKLLQHFGEMPLKDIGQEEIDVAAVALYPTCAPSTRNRQVYTPVSAILKRAGFKDTIDRPFGAAGNKATGWLWPEQAEVLFEEAGKLDPEFRLLCLTLLYAGGLRLSEGLGLLTDDCRLSRTFPIRRTMSRAPCSCRHFWSPSLPIIPAALIGPASGCSGFPRAATSTACSRQLHSRPG
jgi:hypothetical protein